MNSVTHKLPVYNILYGGVSYPSRMDTRMGTLVRGVCEGIETLATAAHKHDPTQVPYKLSTTGNYAYIFDLPNRLRQMLDKNGPESFDAIVMAMPPVDTRTSLWRDCHQTPFVDAVVTNLIADYGKRLPLLLLGATPEFHGEMMAHLLTQPSTSYASAEARAQLRALLSPDDRLVRVTGNAEQDAALMHARLVEHFKQYVPGFNREVRSTAEIGAALADRDRPTL